MPAINFILADGTSRAVKARVGASVMNAAQDNFIPGIEAICGGVCACGTCHVYVRPEWKDALPPPDALEDGMLFLIKQRTGDSRLSCQIKVTDALDGLIVEVAFE